MNIQENWEELQFNGTHQLLIYADITLVCDNINIIKIVTEILLQINKKLGVEISEVKTKNM
jgi:hypothetical protein